MTTRDQPLGQRITMPQPHERQPRDMYWINVDTLTNATPSRQSGSGTSPSDPRIIWITDQASQQPARRNGIDEICRQACLRTGSTFVWVRAIDHRTTRQASGRRRQGRRGPTYVRADPHITVFMGRSPRYDFDGHLYCAYSRRAPGVPSRLADPRERQHPLGGPGMELWDGRTLAPVILGGGH